MHTRKRLFWPVLFLVLALAAGGIGGWLWYDNNVDRSGWMEEKDGTRYYRDFHARRVSGWLDLDGETYCFHEDGTPHTGWQEIDGTTYYFDPDGTMYTGWMESGSEIYYFGGNGALVEGWLWLEEGRYYLTGGSMYTGWQTIDEKRYYFHEDGTAALGFTDIDGQRYYFDEGVMAVGETPVGEVTYFFQPDGTLRSGWVEENGLQRYYHENGWLAQGLTELEDGVRYFSEDGTVTTGWVRVGEYDYYFHEDGTAAVGPTTIDGKKHYFSPKGIEVILVNALNSVPSYYEMDLVNVTGWHDVDRRCYDALVRMLADCNAAGIEYNFNSAYRTIEEQTAILEARTKEHMAAFDMTESEAWKKALETVAYPGTSEHHLGLAVDLLGEEAVAWFTEHCWDYGFIVRYTADKARITGIIDEPWHFRYVGTEVSLDMKDSGLCLEEYLGAPPINGG